MRLFNIWSIVTLISNLLLIIGTTLYMIQVFKNIEVAEITIGFGCMLIWISLTKYLETSSAYTFVNRTMSVSLPIVMRAMVGIFPFFMGFVFLGLCLFFESKRFSTPSDSMFTLFAMMNGDSLLDIYSDISYWRFLLANLYTYFFVFISIW